MAKKSSITTKQRAARQRNIKVAQSAKKKNARSGKRAGAGAYKRAYKQARTPLGKLQHGSSKRSSHITGLKAMHKKAPKLAKRKIKAFYRGEARRGQKGISRKQARWSSDRSYKLFT